MNLISTLQSMEPSATVIMFELDFTDRTEVVVSDIQVDVGSTRTGQDYYAKAGVPTELVINGLGSVTGVSGTTMAGGTVYKLYNDTVVYTSPEGYSGTDSFFVNTNEGLVYFHDGTNEIMEPIVWQSNRYSPYPIQAEGFEVSQGGQLPRPALSMANVLSLITGYLHSFDDLLGAKVTRRRTFVKYLDPVNFVGGVNPTADPTAEMASDVYKINRKTAETEVAVEFELAVSWDVEGVKLPRRIIVQNMCPWVYRGAECGYTGPPVADALDQPTTDPKADKCSKHLSGCNLRFSGVGVTLPFGGFPGAGIVRG